MAQGYGTFTIRLKRSTFYSQLEHGWLVPGANYFSDEGKQIPIHIQGWGPDDYFTFHEDTRPIDDPDTIWLSLKKDYITQCEELWANDKGWLQFYSPLNIIKYGQEMYYITKPVQQGYKTTSRKIVVWSSVLYTHCLPLTATEDSNRATINYQGDAYGITTYYWEKL